MDDKTPELQKLAEIAASINAGMHRPAPPVQNKEEQLPTEEIHVPVPSIEPQVSKRDLWEKVPELIQDPLLVLCLFIFLTYSETTKLVSNYVPFFSNNDLKSTFYKGIVFIILFITLKMGIDYLKKKN